ncbi:MAG: 50S ribosomal protein L10 [Planctomycetia bacterium]|nr:50S ribosomal protein L10 [Planctomycetia bacterium]
MSKYVKGLVSNHVRERLHGVESAFLVNVSGMNVNQAVALRRELRHKKITLLVVKNSLALRATEGTPLFVAFQGRTGPSALIWGGDDFVTLAKEVVRIAKDKNYAPFAPTGGILEGAWIGAEEVEKISKWPTRSEMLSRLVAQILGPGATLAAQILGPGGTLAGQIKQKSEGKEEEEKPATGPAAEKPAEGGGEASAPAPA